MTQSEFAAPAHTTSWLCDVERGRNGIDVFDLEDLCRKANVPVSSLLGPAVGPTPTTKAEWELLFKQDPDRGTAHFLLDQAWPRKNQRRTNGGHLTAVG